MGEIPDSVVRKMEGRNTPSPKLDAPGDNSMLQPHVSFSSCTSAQMLSLLLKAFNSFII